jgi:hypothetical protein
MKYQINPKLKGTLIIPVIKNAVFKANDVVNLTEEQISDKYISTAIKKNIILKIEDVAKAPKIKVEKVVEVKTEVKPNPAAWDADKQKLIDAKKSAKKTLDNLNSKDNTIVQSHDINLDLSDEKEEIPVKTKRGRPKNSNSMKKAKNALDKAVKDIEIPKAVDRKKKEDILDLDRLTETKEDSTDFVFDNSQKDTIDFVDLEQDKARSRKPTKKAEDNNQEIK